MGPRDIWHSLDFSHIQNSKIGFPPLKEKKLIVVRAKVFRHGLLTENSVIEHAAECGSINFSGMYAS
jgi:hypothetical protein